MLELTEEQRNHIAKSVARMIREKNIVNPTGFTLLSFVRSAAKSVDVVVPNIKSVNSWFPSLLSHYLEEQKSDEILGFIAELDSRVASLEENVNIVIQQNDLILKYIKRLLRRSSKAGEVPVRPKQIVPPRELRVVIVGMEGGYREHLKNKLKGMMVHLTFKHYRDSHKTYGHFDYVVYFDKHGHYYAASKDAWPDQVLHGTGSLSSVADVILKLIERGGVN